MRENENNEKCTFLTTNLDSFLNKKDELLAFLEENVISVAALTEIKAKNQKDVTEVEYNIPGYECFMNKQMKLGTAIYVKEEMQAQLYTEFEKYGFDENVFCHFTTIDNRKVLVGCIYRSPSSTDENSKKLIELIRDVGNKHFDFICLTGDFNWKNLNWQTCTSANEIEMGFFEALKDGFLTQIVEKPTRRRGDQAPSLLDLVIVNDEDIVSEVKHHSAMGKSDHEVLCFDLMINYKKEKDISERYIWSKGKYEQFRNEVQEVDWKPLEEKDVNDSWLFIKEKVLTGIEKYIPKKKIGGKRKLIPAWMCKSVLKKIKKKYHLYKRYLETRDGLDYQRYIAARNECTKKVRKAKREHERKIAKNSKLNSKVFWKHVRSKTKATSGVSALKTDNGETATNDVDKADILNSYFSSVFTREDTNNVPHVSDAEYSEGITLSEVVVTPAAVKEKLLKLNVNKAHGPDGIPPRVLKELATELAEPLSLLFNKSIQNGIIPNDWKEATVTAIFKKGSRSEPGNYRPVSLTCILCKILEQFIRDAIVDHMNLAKLYSNCQHGFRQHRSCVTQLLEVMEDFTKMFDDREDFDIVYLDFRKAFDSVPHTRLLSKLRGYGVVGSVLDWIRAFLTDRTQRVRVGNEMSDMASVISGIPQGSILGPVLFTLFINDLPESVTSVCKIFADDTKLYNITKNAHVLQSDIDNLVVWSDTWDLHFNALKCKVMHVGTTNPEQVYQMKAGNDRIDIVKCEEEKDLGVTFDKCLKFDKHVNAVVSKANKMTGLIKRSFSYLDEPTFTLLYKSLIRPHLEYGNAIWSPLYKKHSQEIERVQRRATKLLPHLKNLTYGERMKRLRLPSLKYRRLRGDLIQAYKIFKHFDDIDANKFFTEKTEQRTRHSADRVFIRQCRTDRRKNCFSFRVAPEWNNLPAPIKNANTINRFKNLLDKHFKDKLYNFD